VTRTGRLLLGVARSAEGESCVGSSYNRTENLKTKVLGTVGGTQVYQFETRPVRVGAVDKFRTPGHMGVETDGTLASEAHNRLTLSSTRSGTTSG